MNLKILSTLFLLLFLSIFSFSQNGTITGVVRDSDTKETLIGATIVVQELSTTGTASDVDGNFSLSIPVGIYSVRVSMIGYKPVVKTNLAVKSNGRIYIEFLLEENTFEIDEVTIRADYFDKALIKNNLSTINLSSEEVKKSPGAMNDFQRVLQAMPGVSFSNDQNNELLVRGGSPNENLTVLDHMELHSTNHYPNEFNSGGPINMVNTDLIQDIQFSTGGFISKYGDKLSSVMNIQTREGNRDEQLAGELNLHMAGVGAIAEGSINKGKGSWLVSFRKSYLDLIAGSVGLTAIPKYYDGQFKFVYDLSKKHKLIWTGIYGNDRIDIDGESTNIYPEKANEIDSVDVYNIDVKQSQWATGLTLKSLWSDKFFSNITLYANSYKGRVNVKSDFNQRTFDADGGIDKSDLISSRRIFDNTYRNTEVALKAEMNYYLSKKNKLEFGASFKMGEYVQEAFIDADTVRYDLNNDMVFDHTVILPASSFENDFNFFEDFKTYVYFNNQLKFINDKLVVNWGLRYDYFSFSERGNLSPRLSFSYFLKPDVISLNFAYGEYYQTHSYMIYGDRYQTFENQYLKNTHARHFVLGMDYVLRPGTKMTLEVYHKNYDDMPVRMDFIHFNDRMYRSEKLINIGSQKIYGIDLLIQQKLVNDFYGTLSFSRMWTNVTDNRIGYEGQKYMSDYDFSYIFNIVMGKRIKNARSTLNDMPFFVKYLSYLLPFSDDTEVSLKWRYASGKPYTPLTYSQSEQHRAGGTTWTEGGWIESDQINAVRYPDYHRLDLAMYSRYNFKNWNLVIMLSVQNVYNRKNISNYLYNSDGTIDNVYQYAILPVLGLEIEF